MANTPGIPVWREVGATPKPASATEHLPLLMVGAGPVGLTLALDLARKGHAITLLNRLDFVPAASKAICYAKRTLDIWHRLGVGDAMVARGVVWNVGKVFWGDDPEPVYQFDMLPVKDQRMPGFINLQQYHAEEILLAACAAEPLIDIRWGHKVTGVSARSDGADVRVETDGGDYNIRCNWLLACDGVRSTVRDCLGLDFEGRVFEDNFLIADVTFAQERPSERWFWFDPPFNRGQSALLHKQPDGVWRIDLQLGWDIDRDAVTRDDYVEPLVRGLLGPDVAFRKEWYSVYTFQCRRMARFVHGRVIFAGDSAHLVSPFGARGCNGGVADADNLAWKLDLVLRGHAGESLLESYNAEAIETADENILNSTRSTDFLTPKTAASLAFRNAVLSLARRHSFARPFVNSGRLSTPVSYVSSPLSTVDDDAWLAGPAPGAPALDAPMADGGWLLDRLGDRFVVLSHGWQGVLPDGVDRIDAAASTLLLQRYGLEKGSAYLIRPDQYVAARWQKPTAAGVAAALARACGVAGRVAA